MAMSESVKPDASVYPYMRGKPASSIYFWSKKVESELAEAEKTEYIKFDFFVEPKSSASRYSKEFIIFKGAFPEVWIKWFDGLLQFIDNDVTEGGIR
jgi:hypothetical protein